MTDIHIVTRKTTALVVQLIDGKPVVPPVESTEQEPTFDERPLEDPVRT